MGDDGNKKIEQDVQALFAQVRRVPLEPDRHLSMRVMARWTERQATPRVAPAWRWLGLGASGMSAALAAVLLLWHFQSPTFEAFVGRPFVVKLEIKDLGEVSIAKARIRLPDGVYFDVEDFPELRHQRELTLAWERRDTSEFIPFVVMANVEGKRTIQVDFYDASDVLVGTKRVEVRLRKTSEKG